MFLIEHTTQIVFALPLLGWLFAWYFKVDELAARTTNLAAKRISLTPRVDAFGRQVCMDPDGRVFVPVRKRVKANAETRVIQFTPERRQNFGNICWAGPERRFA